MSLPDLTRIGLVELQISELGRSERFYTEALGFRAFDRESGRLLLSATGRRPIHLALVERPGAVPKPPRSTGLFHLAIRYPTRRALARALKRLTDLGWPLQGFSDHRVSEAIYLADPDGLGLELYRDRPRESWPMRGNQVAMTTEPLDLPDLMATLPDAPESWEGIDPGADIGHVHLQVPDLESARKFYHLDLGLDVTQENYAGALFLSAGGYHHHVGLNVWAGRGAPPPPENAVGLRAFSFRVPGQQALSQACERLRGAGRRVEALGDKWPDPACQVMDPQGIRIFMTNGR